MAVDANVLIFERIREEIANGRSVKRYREWLSTGTGNDHRLEPDHLVCCLVPLYFRIRADKGVCRHLGHWDCYIVVFRSYDHAHVHCAVIARKRPKTLAL